ncbi:GPO family capsid scaffolding protein, partial [Pseudomonas aeruginosa]
MKKFRSKWFRIAVEGATTDGRNIERDWIEQMAAQYDPNTYGARINCEHIK